MTQTAEELVLATIEAFNKFDREAVERLCASDFELISPMSEIRGEPYRGHPGAHQWLDDLEENFESLEAKIDEVVHVRRDRILILGRIDVVGRTSGLDYEQTMAWITDLRDGRARCIWLLFDQDEARRVAPTL